MLKCLESFTKIVDDDGCVLCGLIEIEKGTIWKFYNGFIENNEIGKFKLLELEMKYFRRL